MGGFAFDYVAGTETDLTALGSSSGTQFDFYRIDDTHLLCLSWRSFSTDTWLFVIDHSDPTAVVFGAAVNFNDEAINDHRPTLTQLTAAGDWLLIDPFDNYKRFTISGNTITLGTYLLGFGTFDFASWDGVTGWNHALWEGHDANSPVIDVTTDGRGHVEALGIDVNHILVPGALGWFDGTSHSERKWWVLDLTTSGVQPVTVFDTASGYYPNLIGAAQVGPGVGYWWTWDSWPVGGTPSGLELVLVDTDGVSITTAQVTGYSFGSVLSWPVDNANLNLADDGKWWLGVVASTELELSWTHAAPWVYQSTMVKVDTTTASTLDYLGEADWTQRPALLARVWPFDTGRICDETALLSWQITDGHLRAEDRSSSSYTSDAPHFAAPIGRAGLSHGRMVFAYSAGGNLYAAVYKEIGLPPTPDFSIDNDTVAVGTAIGFDAEDFTGGHDTKEQTRDSYWHPVLEYRWEWDDGLADLFGSAPTVSHTYRRGSATHVTGSQTADADSITHLIGHVGFFLPLLRARNSVGWSYAIGRWSIEVTGPPPPQRQFPRDDGLGISTRRSWPPATSKQYGLRRGSSATYQ